MGKRDSNDRADGDAAVSQRLCHTPRLSNQGSVGQIPRCIRQRRRHRLIFGVGYNGGEGIERERIISDFYLIG
jgi:hypothetical protein